MELRSTTFLSLPLGHWSFSFLLHLVLFSAVVFTGRARFLDLTHLELVLTAPSNLSVIPAKPPEEEWQYPQVYRRVLPPAPKPLPKPETPAQAAPAPAAGPAGDQGTGPYRSAAEVSQLPRFINQVKIQYPKEAYKYNIEGRVTLQVDIDATGEVKKVALVQGLGYGCDEAVMEAIRQSTFSPALENGKPVPVSFSLSYRFRLNDLDQ